MTLMTVSGVCLLGLGYLQAKKGNKELGFTLCFAGALTAFAGLSHQIGAWLSLDSEAQDCSYFDTTSKNFGGHHDLNKRNYVKLLENKVWSTWGIKMPLKENLHFNTHAGQNCVFQLTDKMLKILKKQGAKVESDLYLFSFCD